MKKKSKAFKVIVSIIVIILIILFGSLFTYEKYFSPKVPVTSIDSTIEVNPLELALKLLPNKVDLSLGQLKLNSNIELTENQLTDFAILAVQNNQEIQKFINGLKFNINDNKVTLYVKFTYAKIPLEAQLNFTCLSQDGQAIIHYESGNIGFIKIPASVIFNKLKSNEFITVYPTEQNIALNFKSIKNISINSFTVNGNKLDIGVETSLKLF